MDFPRHIHFIGIGGAGVAPLAELCLARGVSVSGSDLLPGAEGTHLASLGAEIFTGHAPENVPGETALLVYSSAVPEDNPERREARRRGIPQCRRGEFLAQFASRFYRRVVAVSGSHGKSSITALLVRILQCCGFQPGYLVGAQVRDFPRCAAGDGEFFVCEVDESDGTHVFMRSALGVVPNVEPDHEWSVGGWEQLCRNFQLFAGRADRLIYLKGETPCRLFAAHPGAVACKAPAEFAGHCGFRAADAFLACRAAELLNCPPEKAQEAAKTFPQLARRLQCRFSSPELCIIEDYAHHPTEIAATLEWLRKAYPGRHLRVLFQPHRYARLERFFDGFVRELGKADSLLIVPVFAAWSETGNVDSAALARATHGRCVTGSWRDVAVQALDLPQKPAVLAVLGAGDVSRVFPFLPGEPQ